MNVQSFLNLWPRHIRSRTTKNRKVAHLFCEMCVSVLNQLFSVVLHSGVHITSHQCSEDAKENESRQWKLRGVLEGRSVSFDSLISSCVCSGWNCTLQRPFIHTLADSWGKQRSRWKSTSTPPSINLRQTVTRAARTLVTISKRLMRSLLKHLWDLWLVFKFSGKQMRLKGKVHPKLKILSRSCHFISV